jgi:5'-nucleotidase
MRILLTNDDGYDAFGMSVLEGIARQFTDDVWIVAPSWEQSGKGRGVSLHDPVRVRHYGNQRFAVDGTPTDCVQIAINDLLESPPDLLLSGVNRGFNLAQDITLSGTVAGALQGMSLGVRSIALSQCLDFDLDIEAQWQSSQTYGAGIIDKLLGLTWSHGVVFNVNFPDCPADGVKGWQLTKQGFRDLHEMHAVKRTDPRGRDYYWIDFHQYEQNLIKGTDLYCVANHEISVSPIHLDLTHYESLNKLKGLVGGAPPVREVFDNARD